VATTRKSGSPVMHAVWFVYLDNAIYINVQRDSFKMKNILRDNRVCALVEDGESYFELRGVMVEGEAAEVTDDEEILRVQDAQDLKHQRIGSGTENMPSYFTKSREERLKRGDRALVKIPMTKVRSWDFGKAKSHYKK
jgi:nitroimidazol reductase NimA-like FMN-containing flavoprotein (pyridoxamine 5'-phosphate oxidase superfamily)